MDYHLSAESALSHRYRDVIEADLSITHNVEARVAEAAHLVPRANSAVGQIAPETGWQAMALFILKFRKIYSRLMAITGAFGALVFAPLVAFVVLGALSGEILEAGPASVVTWQINAVATLLIVVSTDFCKYWAHRLMHEWPVLWPFHAVHHSAEVLTPLTLVRAHPMDIVLRNLLISVIVGAVQGIILFLFAGEVGLMTIGGANAIYFFVNMLGSNLRHSHIWLSFGRVIEHVLVSPAQHRIDHSSDPWHHDKNYGLLFAVWDWAVGTLYLPERREFLTLGLADSDGAIIPQPHPNLRQALWRPFVESWEAMTPRRPDGPNKRANAPKGRAD